MSQTDQSEQEAGIGDIPPPQHVLGLKRPLEQGRGNREHRPDTSTQVSELDPIGIQLLQTTRRHAHRLPIRNRGRGIGFERVPSPRLRPITVAVASN